MAVVDALVQADAAGQTWIGLGSHAGKRLIIGVADRSGGETATFDSTEPTLDAAVSVIASRVTLPGDGENRRSCFLFTGIIPAGLSTNIDFGTDVRDGSSGLVAHSRIAIVVDEADTYSAMEIASADSDVNVVGSQATGTTAALPAGDVLLIDLAAMRGDTTTTWSIGDDMPGAFNLNAVSGSGVNARRASMAYASLTGQSTQTWADTVTLGTARTASALIAVFSTNSGGETGQSAAPIDLDLTLSGTAAKTGQSASGVDASLGLAGTAAKRASASTELALPLSVDGDAAKHGVSAAELPVSATISADASKTGQSAAPIDVQLGIEASADEILDSQTTIDVDLQITGTAEAHKAADAAVGLNLAVTGASAKTGIADTGLDLDVGVAGVASKSVGAATELDIDLGIDARPLGADVIPETAYRVPADPRVAYIFGIDPATAVIPAESRILEVR